MNRICDVLIWIRSTGLRIRLLLSFIQRLSRYQEKIIFFPSFFLLITFSFFSLFRWYFNTFLRMWNHSKSTYNLMELRKIHEEKSLEKGPELLGRVQVLTKLHKAMQEGIFKSWVARWRKVHKSQLKIFLKYLFCVCSLFGIWDLFTPRLDWKRAAACGRHAVLRK